jgi:hypothetical protein
VTGIVRVQSARRVLIGAGIALVVPISFLMVGQLLLGRVLTFERGPDTMDILTRIALSEIILGPIGILVVGSAIPLRRPLAWLLLWLVGVPLLAVIWFLCVATLSGALGSPF